MTRGIIVRHLVIPGQSVDSCAILDRVWELCGNEVDLSVMNQYTPNELCISRGGDLSRSVTEEEYEMVLDHADELGYSLKFMRVILLVLTRIFNLWGFGFGIILNLVLLFTNKTLSGKSYMYPLFPLHPRELLTKLTRIRSTARKTN